MAWRSGGVRGPKTLTEGGAAKHGCGVLNVLDRSVVCAQLGLIVCREGSVFMLNELECGCHKLNLCHASSAVRKGGANEVPVSPCP